VEPSRVGRYDLLEVIGRGGMGVVYRARQVGLNRLVALKMLRCGPDAGPLDLTRFRTEAETIARLQHPNIVQVHDIGERDGRPFVALELVEGGNLAQHLAAGPRRRPAPPGWSRRWRGPCTSSTRPA
jgi:serine/threonine protein kinase